MRIGPLSGVRVLTLENLLNAPGASMVMSDMGAEVIKIEPPQGELSRVTSEPRFKGETSHIIAWNRGKKGMVLDLRTPTGKEAFLDLVSNSDVVINNFRTGVMKRLGFDYDDLKKINPRIICTNLTGWGQSGPYVNVPTNDMVVAGVSGMMSITGYPGQTPLKPGPAVCDYGSALYGVIATTSALYQREKTGVGQNIEVTLLGAAVAYMGYHIALYTVSGIVPGQLGSGYPMGAPMGCYKTKDGYITLGPAWPRICRVIDAEWLMDDPRFATGEARLEHRWELDDIIEKHLVKATSEQWLNILYEEDIAAGPVNRIDQVIEDEQVKHLNLVLNIKHSLGGEIKVAGNPVMMDSLGGDYLPPPTLGQHTDEILRGILGYSEEKLRKLKEEQEANYAETEKHTRKLK